MLITDTSELKKFYSHHRIWQGIPGIARTKNGRTFVSFYSGNIKETYGNYAVVIKSDEDHDFGEPIVAAHKEGAFRCFDPVLWIDPLDRLWFIWNVMPGEQVMASICEDPDTDTLVWGEEFCIGRGIMMNKPTVLSSGEWLFPIAIWKLDIYYDFRKSALRPDDVAGSYVYKTSDNGKTFTCLGRSDMRDRSFDEHMVIELENGLLMMLVRTTYGIGVCYSYDRGKNWSSGEDSKFGGPCSRFFISRLKSGRILLINHRNFKGRNNLTAMLSEDDGKTFPYEFLLDERNNVSYPDAVEGDDGFIYITYDRDRGAYKSSLSEALACEREILTAKVSEQDIINGAIVTEGSFTKNVVSKLGALDPNDPDPFLENAFDNRTFAEALISDGKHIISRIFEHYPVNCINIMNFDAKQLDTLIKRFKDSGSCDVDLLIKIIEFIRSSPEKKTDIYPIIDNAKKYINDHLCEDFSLSELADSMKISIYYLSHLFKSVTGTTIVEYRNELRLTTAKLLLINTNDPIGSIAQKTGFCSAAYLTEVFSKSEKIPPSEYRKYHKK